MRFLGSALARPRKLLCGNCRSAGVPRAQPMLGHAAYGKYLALPVRQELLYAGDVLGHVHADRVMLDFGNPYFPAVL